jgi:hypothetical protein
MAEVNNVYVEQTTRQDHEGDTNWTDISGASISGASLTANTKYLIFAKALTGGGDVGQLVGIKLVTADDATIESKSEQTIEPGYNGFERMQPYQFVHSYSTDASPADIKFQHKTYSATAGDKVRSDQLSILLIDLDDLGSGNYFENIGTDTGTELGVGGSETSVATISAANLGTSEAWALLGYARVGIASTTKSYGVRLQGANDAASASTLNYHFEEGEDTSEIRVHGVSARHKAVTSNVAATVEAWEEDAGTNAKSRGGYLIALKTSAFADFEFDYNSGSITVGSTETELASITYTASTATNHLVVGRANCADATGNSRTACWIDKDGAELQTGYELIFQTHNRDNTDKAMIASAMRESLATSSVVYTLEAKRLAADSDRDYEQRWLLILNLEKAAAGEAATEGFWGYTL